MKKFLLSASVILVFGFYVYSTTFNPDVAGASQQVVASTSDPLGQIPQASASSTPDVSPAPAPSPSPTPTPVPSPDPTPAPVPVRRSGYQDGQYTGDVADAFYGNVQVQAVIKGGKIADVRFLDYPQDRGHTIMVSNYAMPQLISEAIQSQSANVDIVSGATDISQAFIESLSSALSQAKA